MHRPVSWWHETRSVACHQTATLPSHKQIDSDNFRGSPFQLGLTRPHPRRLLCCFKEAPQSRAGRRRNLRDIIQFLEPPGSGSLMLLVRKAGTRRLSESLAFDAFEPPTGWRGDLHFRSTPQENKMVCNLLRSLDFV